MKVAQFSPDNLNSFKYTFYFLFYLKEFAFEIFTKYFSYL